MVAVAALKFSLCNMLWESFPILGVQGIEGLILVGALFPLDGGGERRKKKKIKEEKKQVSPHNSEMPRFIIRQWIDYS
jgi:hypothetical protein